jgi:hypothetical protein
VKLIHVNYDGELGRKSREKESLQKGERGREVMSRRENGVGGKIGQAFDFDLWSKSTCIFLDIANSQINTHFILVQGK